MPDEIKKQFVKSFIKFLKSQKSDKDLSFDGVESIEVAIQCLEAAYEIGDDCDDERGASKPESSLDASIKGKIHLENIDLFEIFQTAFIDQTLDKKQEAEEIKNQGNNLMKEGKFAEALNHYNRAIQFDPTNPVFYCNRAAAYTKLNEFNKAIADCKMSLAYNPNYAKAYGRLGIAFNNLKKYAEATQAYKKALEIDPDNKDYMNNMRMNQQQEGTGTRTRADIAEILMRSLPISGIHGSRGGVENDGAIENPILDELLTDEVMNRTYQMIMQMSETPNFLNAIRQQIAACGQAAGVAADQGINIHFQRPGTSRDDVQTSRQESNNFPAGSSQNNQDPSNCDADKDKQTKVGKDKGDGDH